MHISNLNPYKSFLCDVYLILKWPVFAGLDGSNACGIGHSCLCVESGVWIRNDDQIYLPISHCLSE